MPIVFDTKPLLRPPFSGEEFKATKWESAEFKAEFANILCKFIAADCKKSLFTKALYHRLSNTFGHIAHYDLTGVARRKGRADRASGKPASPLPRPIPTQLGGGVFERNSEDENNSQGT